jgi:hypothetical protein
MADNIDVTPGAGATVRTVDRAGVETQVVIIDKSGGATANVGLTGAKTFSDPAVAANSNGLVLAANTGRKSALIVNNGDGTVYLGKDNTVSASNGIPLGPGQSISDTTSTDAWWAWAPTGVTSDFRVVEVA